VQDSTLSWHSAAELLLKSCLATLFLRRSSLLVLPVPFSDLCASGVLGLAIICKNRVGQNLIFAPYMTVCMVVSLPKIPYVHRM